MILSADRSTWSVQVSVLSHALLCFVMLFHAALEYVQSLVWSTVLAIIKITVLFVDDSA